MEVEIKRKVIANWTINFKSDIEFDLFLIPNINILRHKGAETHKIQKHKFKKNLYMNFIS